MAPPTTARQRRSQKMSFEAALDEERREVLNLLERRRTAPEQPRRHASPAPPVRSMLDVDEPSPAARHGSIAGIGVGVTLPPNSRAKTAPSSPPAIPPVRSMLDINAPPVRPVQSAGSTPTSPVSSSAHTKDKPVEDSQRRASETSTPRIGLPEIKPPKQGVDIDRDYQFDMLPSPSNHALPKRVSQGGKNLAPVGGNVSGSSPLIQSSMATVMSGGEFPPLSGFPRGRDLGRHSVSPGYQRHSSSPSSRLSRSRSPHSRLLNTNSFNPMQTPGKYYTDTGKVINMGQAYKRLSDAAMKKSGGSLAELTKRVSTSRERGTSVDSSSDTDIRVHKDYPSDKENGDDTSEQEEEDEEEEAYDTSSEEDTSTSEVRRGRRRRKTDSESNDENEPKKGPSTLLAAADEERQKVSYTVRSLLDVLDKPAQKKKGVHPTTNFDYAGSTANTPTPSDEEQEMSDIKKAQDMAIYLSPIDQSVPNRGIRTIIRGDFPQMQKEAEEGKRRLRKYLVATDLSEEAVYALEWTIGTILRDGDTLYTVYAIDEDVGSGKGNDVDISSPQSINDGARAIQDAAEVIGAQTEKTAGNQASTFPPPRITRASGSGSESKPGSVDARAIPKGEAERSKAIELISQTCIRFLRKTRLQVRVAVEVIHCKNSKHLITEAIDELEPTLVILGSRGRSSFKGVLLGSFSNYLVTKSSVPVMVARKKLRKHNKFKATSVRLSNNLTTPNRLTLAKID
ncbi:hypothetical protein VTO42DRAFT_6667 [Malbranchea cinnamomea]